MSTKEKWIEWFDRQGSGDQRTIALVAIERLMELEEVSFHEGCESEQIEPYLYWDSCGEDLRIPF